MLEAHATTDHSDVCLSYLFTAHDFNRTLGNIIQSQQESEFMCADLRFGFLRLITIKNQLGFGSDKVVHICYQIRQKGEITLIPKISQN